MEVFILIKYLSLFILIIYSLSLHAFDVVVECRDGFNCDTFSEKLKKSLSNKKRKEEVIENIRFFLLDESIKDLEFEFNESKLIVKFSQKPIIKDVDLTGEISFNENIVKKTLRLAEGGYFNPELLEKGIARLKQYYQDRGFEEVVIKPSIKNLENGVVLSFDINTGNSIIVKNIEVLSEDNYVVEYVKSRLRKFKRKPWNLVEIKILLDALNRELFSRGYFFSSIKLIDTPALKGFKDLKVSLSLGMLYNFNFRGNKIISRGEFLNELKEFLLNNFEKVTPELIVKSIEKSYLDRGVYKTKVTFRQFDGKTKTGEEFRNIYFDLKEGRKIPVRKLVIKGAEGISKKEVLEYFYENATTLASRNYLDEKFLKEFPALLKRLYLQRGFLFIESSEPIITYSPDRSFCNVTFQLNERQQSILHDIDIPNVPKELYKKITKNLNNKVGSPLNIVNLEEDLNAALAEVKDEGYYFARLNTSDPTTIIEHQNNYNRSKIVIDIDLGKKTLFESVMATGQVVTLQKVIARELRLEKNDIITPRKIQEIKERIIALGLFSQVKITPFVTNRDSNDNNYFVNLLIQVSEKDFGSGEVAPGYRTDIGFKVSTKVAYNNLLGLNHSASVKAQTNLRDNLNSLDARRKTENRNLQEYLLRLNYTWPFAFPSRWKAFHNTELSFSTSIEQRRLFSFDAKIQKVSLTLSKDITEKLSASLKYQYERISQFDSSTVDNDGTFIIGGLTPSLNLDLRKRNNSYSPTSGAFFGLSMEFANPTLGSLARDDLEINFWKIVSRNKFYYPLTRNWTLALSVSTGIQKNLEKTVIADSSGRPVQNENGVNQTLGFIPSIKVFRLDGPDAVRGFATSEINRLDNESDISQVRIQDRVYFSNIKFEPRYSLSDSVVIGPFFDAGRLYVNNFKPLELRTSAGLSLKFVTPAGTLDFDYGLKLKGRKLSDGGKEGFGRFHLSIGFF